MTTQSLDLQPPPGFIFAWFSDAVALRGKTARAASANAAIF
jgi:hypothetical protein